MTAGAMFEFGPKPIQCTLSFCVYPLTDQHHPNAMSYPNPEQAAVLSHLNGTLLVFAPGGHRKNPHHGRSPRRRDRRGHATRENPRRHFHQPRRRAHAQRRRQILRGPRQGLPQVTDH